MGALILIVMGAALGWLGTIVLRIEDGRLIFGQMLAGTAGSLLAGLFGGNASIVGGVSGGALAWATLGALGLIAAYNLLRRRLAQ
ncbi:GlsB/YeaQ/YmgE family stress response membrane protein [Erythrobacter mangrovi]|uniref:GlsB/YeaQ/YmgE family stress response membrane protein n=1 Tax=Erythrobacter mangrovi TaxID=2739433 RepID=A0A7D3XGV0_9SPHN|nr:GlsB/YeaQ/YmgE family stress response membrane protein [Erythrobacter mangrovi]QKG70753.1 GlsB/YeaQ/YmgE family stress response membrane protein [Erythrobacter mangrovi]